MKVFIFTTIALGFAAIGHGQQKHADTTKVNFTPPVIVKDEQTTMRRDEVVKFTLPVIGINRQAASGRKPNLSGLRPRLS